LSLPKPDQIWLEIFSRGLLATAKRFDCPLVGGDLIRGVLHIAIQVHGLVPAGKALRRSTASPGDLVYVTGTLGDAAVALAIMQSMAGEQSTDQARLLPDKKKLANKHRDYFIQRFYQPEPRLAAGMLLRDHASACIDLSDGLISDLGHIAADSGAGAEVDIEQLPFSPAMLEYLNTGQCQRAALFGGDDYELCFTVAPENCAAMEQALGSLPLSVKRVGEIVTTPGIRCLNSHGEEVRFDTQPFAHFPVGRES
jgi:thiamine-monophosphate kinase